MARLSGATVATLVVLGALLASGTAVAGPGNTPVEQVSGVATTDQFTVEVYANGSARWRVQYLRPLDNQSQRQQFEAFADRFTSTQTGLEKGFHEAATGLTQSGTNVTGRTMHATTFQKRAAIEQHPDDTGVVALSFLWTNFTTTENGQTVIGDAFEGGLSFHDGQSLTITAGPKLDIQWPAVEPEWDSRVNDTQSRAGSVTWDGPVTFADAHPHVAFVPADDTASHSNGFPVRDVAFGGGLALVVVAVAVLVVLFWRSRRSPSDSGSGATAAGTDGGTTLETRADDTQSTESPSGLSEDALRTDEDRVSELLRDNGGRMKQVNIVAETGWSKSKVSTLLSEMAEEGKISKLRLGRENIVSLAGHEPDVTDSSFDGR